MTIIFYDGTCKFCDKFVNFVIDRDSQDHFRFATLQNALAKEKLTKFGFVATDLNTLYIITDFGETSEQVYKKSTAVLIVLKQLGGILGVLSPIALIIPHFMRDPFYSAFARLRYKLFGQYSTCKIPSPEIKAKFID
jgi:predicted DCC family thiol-disulfide oxidoreductase YuxK